MSIHRRNDFRNNPKVFVTRQIAESALERLKARATVTVWKGAMPPPRARLRAALRDCDAVLSMVTDNIDAVTIARSPRLAVISNLAVGLDNVDVKAATAAGIAVGNTPGVLTEATADLAFALLMATARRVVEGDRMVREGRWKTWGPEILLGREVYGATLGIIGWGAIGRAMARRGAGFGMRILYLAHRSSKNSAAQSRPGPPRTALGVALPRLLAESDFVSIHVPLTPQTRHLIGSRELGHMKQGAILINTARGAVVDQNALVRALRSGRLAGAGLDVTDPEPIGRDHPLLKLHNVVITPHIGSAGIATRVRMAEMAVDNILSVLDGHLPPWCANPEVKMKARLHRGSMQPDRAKTGRR